MKPRLSKAMLELLRKLPEGRYGNAVLLRGRERRTGRALSVRGLAFSVTGHYFVRNAAGRALLEAEDKRQALAAECRMVAESDLQESGE